MNEQERQVIDDIFRRLEQVANQPRDPEAERYIADKLRRQPYAPYALAQSVFVQEQAVANLGAELEQLRAEQQEQPRQPQGGGFLSGLFGGREPEPSRTVPATGFGRSRQGGFGGPQGHPQQDYPQAGGPMQGGPWGGGMMQPRGGGGFLSGALTTAAGVAGGMMVANALSHAFSGNESGAADKASSLFGNASEKDAAPAEQGDSTPFFQDASADEPDPGGDFGGDGGDGGDWA